MAQPSNYALRRAAQAPQDPPETLLGPHGRYQPYCKQVRVAAGRAAAQQAHALHNNLLSCWARHVPALLRCACHAMHTCPPPPNRAPSMLRMHCMCCKHACQPSQIHLGIAQLTTQYCPTHTLLECCARLLLPPLQFITPELNNAAQNVLCQVKMLQARPQAPATAAPAYAPACSVAQRGRRCACLHACCTTFFATPVRFPGPAARANHQPPPALPSVCPVQCIDGARASRRDSKRFFCSLKEVRGSRSMVSSPNKPASQPLPCKGAQTVACSHCLLPDRALGLPQEHQPYPLPVICSCCIPPSWPAGTAQ